MRFAFVMTLVVAGCGGDNAQSGADLSLAVPSDGGGGGPVDDDGGNAGGDGAASAMPDLAGGGGALDLASLDLAGLTNCFGAAICNPGTSFCLRFHDGSQAQPGNLTGGPACFEPADTCANQGQPMNCSCIQNDANLGVACQGSCVDHGDGTYDCYKQ